MKRRSWLVFAAICLVLCSVGLYGVHYLLFDDAHHILIYLMGDIAFVPLEVLLVAVVLERLLAHNEHQRLKRKMNTVIGIFFNELGQSLLHTLTPAVTNLVEAGTVVDLSGRWDEIDFRSTERQVRTVKFAVDPAMLDIGALRDCLEKQRPLLLQLLANPQLIDDDRFADLLWAVCHLSDELLARKDVLDLPATDLGHLAGDTERVYGALLTQWLGYCRHLKRAYPYMFSLVVRTHPLRADASPVIIDAGMHGHS